jgi:hypothetical protein
LDDIICTYGNFTLVKEREYEEDNIKNYFLVYENGKFLQMMPCSPYRSVSLSDFRKWIECGMPSRDQMNGHFGEDLDRYYNRWLDNQLDKLLIEEMTDAL